MGASSYGETMMVLPLSDQALDQCAWAGNDTHRGYVREAIRRSEKGEVDFLALANDEGVLVSMGGVDYTRDPGAPTLWMLATDPEKRSLGYGRQVVAALEQGAARRGHRYIRLLVEDNNPRAYDLYLRLGYTDTGVVEHESWQSENGGVISTYHATCTVMQKDLAAAPHP